MKNIKLANSVLATVLSLALFNAGCASTGRKIDVDALDKIEKGVSTQEDVRSLIGSPDTITTANGKTTYTYTFARAAAGVTSYIPLVNNFTSNTKVQSQAVTIAFDEKGVVESVVSSMGATESSTGIESGRKNKKLGDVEKDKRKK